MGRRKTTGIVVLLAYIFTAILPVLLLTISLLNAPGNASVFLIIISFILVFAGIVVQYFVFSGVTKGHQALIEAFRQAKEGNLKVRVRKDKNLPVSDLIKEGNDSIRCFQMWADRPTRQNTSPVLLS